MHPIAGVPLISVIISAYNQANFIGKTLDSVLAQTFTDFEVIVINNGSTDDTGRILDAYTQQDARIKVYHQANAGRGPATNTAVSYAAGRFCALLDADDLMVPERLEKQLAFHLANSHIAASASHCYYIDKDGNHLGTQEYAGLESEAACRKAMEEKQIVFCAITSLMITREAYNNIGGFDKDYWPSDDIELANKIVERGYLLVILQEHLMKYRVHNRSESMSKQWELFVVSSYTYHNISMRMQGLPTITLQEFKLLEKAMPWRKRLKLRAHRAAIIYHKLAKFSLHKKSYLKFACQIFVALLCDRGYVLTSVRRKLKPGQ